MDNQQHHVMMPIFMRQEPQQTSDYLRAEVPPRVRVAQTLLEQLTAKAAVVPLPHASYDGKVDYEAIPGQELTVEERKAQVSALNLLADYFKGTLRQCKWDGVRDNQAVVEASDDPQGWNYSDCPGCVITNMAPKNNCFVCGGKGRVRIARV